MVGNFAKLMLFSFVLLFAPAQSALAGYEEGVAAFEKEDYATAVKEWSAAGKKGDWHAQYRLGQMYRFGTGVDEDVNKAAALWEKAADKGDGLFQYDLAQLYLGKNDAASDLLAEKWIEKAAKKQYLPAIYLAGFMCWTGRGSHEKDFKSAAMYFDLVANAEPSDASGDAQYALGQQYVHGLGVEKDYVLALKWLVMAHFNEAQQAQSESLIKWLIENMNEPEKNAGFEAARSRMAELVDPKVLGVKMNFKEFSHKLANHARWCSRIEGCPPMK